MNPLRLGNVAEGTRLKGQMENSNFSQRATGHPVSPAKRGHDRLTCQESTVTTDGW